MSSSSAPDRAQTEPLAALLAVALVALAVGAHAGLLGTVLPGQSEREIADATAERVWADLRDDGVYAWNATNRSSVDVDSLPRGRYVYVNVTRTTDEDPHEQDWGTVWRPDGDVRRADGPPDHAELLARPIPIRTDAGTVVTGRLWVAVWEP